MTDTERPSLAEEAAGSDDETDQEIERIFSMDIDLKNVDWENSPSWDPAKTAAVIAAIIREKPRVYKQDVWFSGTLGWVARHDDQTPLPTAAEMAARDWSCGATACVAGHAAILHSPAATMLSDTDRLIFPGGSTFSAATLGMEALGLDHLDADWLFNEDRTQEEVLEALDTLAAGRSISHLVYDGYDGEEDDW